MEKVIWLVAGNKGGAGKSVVAKSLVEWLYRQAVPAITIVDGDHRTPDVAAVFSGQHPTQQLDLHDDAGWPLFADLICRQEIRGHLVTNLPDGINERAIHFFKRFATLVASYGFQVRVLFVMSTLPDGLHLLTRLVDDFPDAVLPVKNLHFGNSRAFAHFDQAYGRKHADRTILFPAMNPRVMQVVREANLSFSDFINQRDNSESNCTYAKIVVADWFDSMQESLSDFLLA